MKGTTKSTSASSSKHPAEEHGSNPVVPKRTLLVVDDDESPRKALAMIFGGEYELLVAETGEQALEMAQTHLIDTAIVDIRMPGISGIDVLAGLKRIDPATEVIIVTAYQTLETARQALRLGARDYLVKPFSVEEIRNVVAAAMEHRNAAGRLLENARLLNELQQELENQRQLVDSSQIRGELYAGIIHDLNSPLTVISGMAEVLGERLSGVSTVEGKRLQSMRDDVAQLNKHVERCLEISRRYLELFRRRAHSEGEAYLKKAFYNLEELLAFHPAQKKNVLTFENFAGDVAVPMNALDLEQVLANLVLNALTCTPYTHKVWVDSKPLNEPLKADMLQAGAGCVVINEQRFKNEGQMVMIQVRDNGVGIPQAAMNRIFQPYFSAREAGQGTGLGLSVVRHLVSETQGLMRVESEYGKGTIVTLVLPLIPGSTPA